MGVTKIKDELKKEKEESKETKKEEIKKEKKEEVRHEMREVVRVANTDLDGSKPLLHALRGISGVSFVMSRAICRASNLDEKRKLGSLNENDIAMIENVLKDPINAGIPVWLVNRRKDRETGLDRHLSGSDILVAKRFDIQRLIDLKTYKGVKHMLGLPVRGQRTRSSFRKGRSVGVIRKEARILLEKESKKEKKR